MKPPMRSSIACLRCRRSKIKCDNDGGNSPCETCIKAGHQCQYPEATPLPPKRTEPLPAAKQDRESGNERKRAKKVEEPPVLDSQRSTTYAAEVLSYPFLTGELWDQVFALYKLHFATELPFLHLPTLKERMSRKQAEDDASSPDLNLVLLGVLTLTARFHADLAKYVVHMSASQTSGTRPRQPQAVRSNPSAAGDFFANALTAALGPLNTAMTVATVERVQAFLMLGLYEWGQRRPDGGIGAWMYVGVAIRLAQALRLGFDDRPRRAQLQQMSPIDQSGSLRGPRASSEVGITREVRRRTMFSCFILDRMMACGTERSSIIRPEDLEIQLPCTEMAFDLALDVHTGYLRPSNFDAPRAVTDDSVLSRFVQVVDLWGEIARFCVAGGRLINSGPPWQSGTRFRTLRDSLDYFTAELPETFTLSRQNYYRHDNHQATSMYVSLHMLISVCQIVLHREYLPSVPMRSSGPQGVLGFLDPSGRPLQAPERFWEASADEVFKAARNIVDLIEICREKLPLSFLTLFATWQAAFFGIYANHFPWMDMRRQMASEEDIERRTSGDLDVRKSSTTGVTYQTLNKIASYLNRAHIHIRYFHEVDNYFATARIEFSRHSDMSRPLGETSENGRLGIRHGERIGFDNSTFSTKRPLHDSAVLAEEPRRGFDRTRDSVSERGSSTSDPARTPRSTPSMTFTAINNHAQAHFAPTELPPITTEVGRGNDYRQHSGTTLPTLVVPPLGEPRGLNFSIEKFDVLELQRIATMMNDLQEFSGAGSLGGEAWDGTSYDR